MILCVLIPAKNESLTISETIKNLDQVLSKISVNYLVVNDHSDDNTEEILKELCLEYPNLRYVNNQGIPGVGNAISYGLKSWEGDLISLCMADGSDFPRDVLRSYEIIKEGNSDCVFGSRFIEGGTVYNYPLVKLVLNRIFNNYTRIKSKYEYNDFTNIFKTYKRTAINEITPILSDNFSIGMEMSIKAFKQGMRVVVIPISWRQREAGKSKLNLRKNFNSYIQTLKYL